MCLSKDISNKNNGLYSVGSISVIQLPCADSRKIDLLRDRQRSPNINGRGEVIANIDSAITSMAKR